MVKNSCSHDSRIIWRSSCRILKIRYAILGIKIKSKIAAAVRSLIRIRETGNLLPRE
jgi:hypothetical protein